MINSILLSKETQNSTLSQLQKAIDCKERIICVYHEDFVEQYLASKLLDFKKVDFTNVFETQTLPQYFTQDAPALIDLFFTLMNLHYKEEAWLVKCISLFSCVIPALVYKRDNYGVKLDARLILDNLALTRLEELYLDATLPYYVRQSIRGYLIALPGYDSYLAYAQNFTFCMRQHDFIKCIPNKIFTALGYQYNLFFSDRPTIHYEELYSGHGILLFKYSLQDPFPYFFMNTLVKTFKEPCGDTIFIIQE